MKRHSSFRSVIFIGATLLAGAGLVTAAGCAPTETRSGTGEFIDDTVITTRVKTAIAADRDLSAMQINVETFRGVVQLSGFVTSSDQIPKATRVAREVPGVQEVKNDIRVRPSN
jgi:osmotically-inducible protein OsmY